MKQSRVIEDKVVTVELKANWMNGRYTTISITVDGKEIGLHSASDVDYIRSEYDRLIAQLEQATTISEVR